MKDDINKDIEVENSEDFMGIKMIPVFDELSDKEDFSIDHGKKIQELPLLVLRDNVLFPGLVMPISVGRNISKNVLKAVKHERLIFGVVTQKDPSIEIPNQEDLLEYGVVASLERFIEMPNGTHTAIIKGHQRIHIKSIKQQIPFLLGEVDVLKDKWPTEKQKGEFDIVVNLLKTGLIKLSNLEQDSFIENFSKAIENVYNPIFITSHVMSRLSVNIEEKQKVLSINILNKRVLYVMSLLQSELELISIKERILDKTRSEINQQQKEYFLNQQIKNLQEELDGPTSSNDSVELREAAKRMNWPDHVGETFEKELKKLERLYISSPDYSIQLQYCQTILSLPWNKFSSDNLSIENASKVLESHHFGMEKVKERILEYLSVLKLKGDLKSPILCLYGPPGVGKTSIGKSIAESLGRKYVRISLGGIHDESEIRGHRRTYIGSMVGRIIQGIRKAGTSNPVFILDEIDKISTDYKGDPSSALLEVLDPEQNNAFHDNYLDIDYDLSKVLFIATANDISRISGPLRDRMELVEVSGYIDQEKAHIAKNYLIPKVLDDHGIDLSQLEITDTALDKIIEDYTRESGVRSLQNKLSEVARKSAKILAQEDKKDKIIITEDKVLEFLGRPIFYRTDYQGNDYCGVVTGLAWTSVGGEILFIESSLHKGTESKLILTGNMGDVMKESAMIALDYVRAHMSELNIKYEDIENKEIHIHIPEGAIPKDGPSAGITMVTSIVSAMTRRKVKNKIAMTGEITLRGKVLPVGGIKEKILAAKRAGILEIILSKENKRHIEEINVQYTQDMTFRYVEDIKEVLELALTNEIANK